MALLPHPINCILPPHIVDRIAEHGSEAQKERARVTRQVSSQLREQRVALAAQKPAPAIPISPLVAAKNRVIYSADNTSGLPGRVVRQEGGPPTNDPAADEAYDGAGATFDLYWDVYQRNSIDGNGMRLDSTVHYQKGYDNAFWNGQQMVYGDGDEDLPAAQRLFNRFTIAIDVIGHELTHGVTQNTGNLVYFNQPGALNESFSDVFGSLVKQKAKAQPAQTADWIIGEGLFTANVNGVGIRSMKAPGTAYNDPVLGKDPQPGHMQNYVNTTDDNGGVHINSGIPNHAFYLIAVELGGYAWEKAGQIWFVTLRDKIKSTSNFQDMANLTFAVAGDLFGANSLEQQAVSKGWTAVGLAPTGGTPPPVPPPTNPGCLSSLLGLFKVF